MPKIRCWIVTAVSLATLPLTAQFYPQGSQVISYFPHLTVGGPSGASWTTTLTFVNPHQTVGALATAYFYDDNGNPLALDFGSGPVSTFNFSVPAQGSITLRATTTSSVARSGWGVVASGLPLQGVLQYILSSGGVPQQGVSVQATPASHLFRSPATRNTGVALANPNGSTISVNVQAIDASGKAVAQTSATIPAFGHTAFQLFQVLPTLASTFQGSVVINAPLASFYFVALTLGADGVLSSNPPSGQNWPVSQYEEIWKVWMQVLTTAEGLVPLNPAPKLVIDPTTSTINSFANPTANEVHIFLNLAELISDSESELAFVIGHELGHIIQGKVGLQLVPGNLEQDADQYGMLLGLFSGYDPYGAAGALAKLAMASGDAGLISQNFDNLAAVVGTDLHGSFNNRLSLVFQNMQSICTSSQFQGFCNQYKTAVHPHLPPTAPLSAHGSVALPTGR